MQTQSSRRSQPNPRDLADVVLSSVFELGAAIVRLSPIESARREHELIAFCDGAPIASGTMGSHLASAVVLRLAAIAGIDLMQPEGRAGRARISYEGQSAEVLVCCHSTPLGLAADVMALHNTARPTIEPLPSKLGPGMQVGPYEIKEIVGAGGMGIVYRAEHRMLRKSFALKILRQELLEESPHFSDWFLREARAAAAIKSDWVVDVSDFGTLPDGRPYLAMEMLSGSTLESIIMGEGAMPPARAVDFVKRIARALEATHGAGVVHRDLSPNNVVIESDVVKLVDFGAAMFVGQSEDNAGDGDRVLGTPHYLAPERAHDGSADERTDLYALGIMFFEMLTGRPPFAGKTLRGIIQGHVRGKIPPVESPYGELPAMTAQVINRLTARDPNDRYASASELCVALTELEAEIAACPGVEE